VNQQSKISEGKFMLFLLKIPGESREKKDFISFYQKLILTQERKERGTFNFD